MIALKYGCSHSRRCGEDIVLIQLEPVSTIIASPICLKNDKKISLNTNSTGKQELAIMILSYDIVDVFAERKYFRKSACGYSGYSGSVRYFPTGYHP